MDPSDEDLWAELSKLSDEELGRLLREGLIQIEDLKRIINTNKTSRTRWFKIQLDKYGLTHLLDGWQHDAEKEFGIENE